MSDLTLKGGRRPGDGAERRRCKTDLWTLPRAATLIEENGFFREVGVRDESDQQPERLSFAS